MMRYRKTIRWHALIVGIAAIAAGCSGSLRLDGDSTVVISIVGTNDVHGELTAHGDRGGLVTFSGYVAALRDVRSRDGGVLLVDAGDMWQGTLASNLSEGAVVVQAYNALGYAAAAIGNHEFDFGPEGEKAIPENASDDPRGALRKRATETDFPLLAANLIDEVSGDRVEWNNVYPSTMVKVAGIRVGLVGALTENALHTTIAANTTGLRMAPLAAAITAEARKLRADGAQLVIALAHAGSRCDEFGDPHDLSSCRLGGEIMRVANAIPQGLVDHIVAGHVHQGIAHVVNGIAVTSSYSSTRAFSRVDFTLDRATGQVLNRHIHPPQPIRPVATYEGVPVVPIASVVAVSERGSELAEQRKAEKLGVYLDTAMTLRPGPESELGNLMTDAVREMTDADIAIHNVRGGIRAELPAGDLTYGSVFRMFPFDNRIAIIELSGAELRRIVARQVHNVGRRAGFSGMRVFVECNDDHMLIRMSRPDGSEIADGDVARVAVNDFLLLGGDDVLTPVIPPEGFDVPADTPLVRDTLLQWFRKRGGHLDATLFFDASERRWNLPAALPESCTYSD